MSTAAEFAAPRGIAVVVFDSTQNLGRWTAQAVFMYEENMEIACTALSSTMKAFADPARRYGIGDDLRFGNWMAAHQSMLRR
ncbi:hypothetical protein CCMA1212_005475 [Trichoderma ghanense]|uniref:Uncharacterized protein n=1 Tax=Trichoderma ghanense TaxID=65468 RepID=A0ABY2H6Q4_9HYPO